MPSGGHLWRTWFAPAIRSAWIWTSTPCSRTVCCMNAGSTAPIPLWRISPMDAIVDLVDTYTQEIAARANALRCAGSSHGWIIWLDASEDEPPLSPDAPVRCGTDDRTPVQRAWNGMPLRWWGLPPSDSPASQGDHLKVDAGRAPYGRHRARRHWDRTRISSRPPTPGCTNPHRGTRAGARRCRTFCRDSPHDAPDAEADPIASLGGFGRCGSLSMTKCSAPCATIRRWRGRSGSHPAWYLTQAEEYGRRLHADERRSRRTWRLPAREKMPLLDLLRL